MKKQLKNRIKRVLHTTPRAACRRFNLLNTLTRAYPITLAPHTITTEAGETIDLITVTDEQQTFTISRSSRISLYRNGIDKRLHTLKSLYLLDELTFTPDDIIIDCGANVGELTTILQRQYDVHAICAEPEALEVHALRCNTDSEKTDIHEVLLWNERTTLEYYPNNDTGDSTIFKPAADVQPLQQTAVPLSELVQENSQFKKTGRIKLLKVEAEGAEPEILQGARDILPNVEYVTVDCGPERGLKHENTLIDSLDVLLAAGLKPIQFSHTRTTLLCRNERF